MRRRQFIGAVGGAIAALETPSGYGGEVLPSPQTQNSAPAENYGDVPAAGPGDGEAYFTEERLKGAVDTSIRLDDKRFEVVAYNYPSWHPSPFMEERFGKGWTEFEVLRNSKPFTQAISSRNIRYGVGSMKPIHSGPSARSRRQPILGLTSG